METELRANIERFDLSGHADRQELLDFANDLSPRAVVLTHGDPIAREVFRNKLEGGPRTILDPIPLTPYEV
jgi:Cft2 family RNA processing exonuclease